MEKISFPSRHKVRFQPNTDRWNIHLIRHKKKNTYPMKSKYAITITDLSEHTFNAEMGEWAEFDMQSKPEHVHTEVEVSDCRRDAMSL